jgi:hypothetical protein
MSSDNEHGENVELRVFRFTAEHLSVDSSQLWGGTRLAQDLGVDGDDAVEFFDNFGKSFDIDLHDLYANWERHFLPEAGPMSLGVIVVLCGSAIAGFILKAVVGVLPAWAWMILLITMAFIVYQKWFADEDSSDPITLNDLVEGVRARRWNKSYPNDSWRYWR